MLALDIQQLTKRYEGGVLALDRVDIQVEKGSFFGLLGPNGAGKTTLIHVLTGLLQASSGQAKVMGHDVALEPEAAKFCLGLVSQEFNFNLFFSVEQVLLNFAGYYGVPCAQAKERAEWALKTLGLWDKRHANGRSLSGGMKRRLMIARALMHSPDVLILDEPTAGVDVELRRLIWKLLRELNAQGTSIILTTHYLEEAEALCDRLAIIHQGRVVRQGPMQALLQGLAKETLVLELMAPAETELLLDLPGALAWRWIKSDVLEVDVTPGLSIGQIAQVLATHGLDVRRLKHKVNPLEELFLGLTGGEGI